MSISKTRLYRTWIDMRARCYRPTCHNFANYGGRGVRVCAKWLNSFAAFKAWALSSGYTDDLTIDRIDSNDHYYPENCHWITADANRRKRKNGGLDLTKRRTA